MPEAKKPNRLWALAALVLVAVTLTGAGVALTRYQPAEGVEITLPTEPALSGSVSIGGAVTNPGIYAYTGEDTIDSLLKAAGGTTSTTPPSLSLEVQAPGAQPQPQKVNINTADVWLLDALPGIGETRAKTIIAYRELHGPFRTTSEIQKVEGFGPSLYAEIKDLITVTD